MTSASATVFIETTQKSPRDLLGKIWYSDRGGVVRHADLVFEETKGTLSIDGVPQSLVVALLSRMTGEIIDEYRFDSFAPVHPATEFEESSDDLENMILGGESETLEFKEKVENGVELAISVSGFANTRGGRIVVGVNKYGVIVGCNGQTPQDRYRNIIDDTCEPPPIFTMAAAVLHDKTVWVINVPESANKPAVVRRKGIYVRSGATTRRINRHDFDEIAAARTTIRQSWE